MLKSRAMLLILISASILLTCGPDTIFLRPELDTPARHVSNGHQLLECGKIEDAYREFSRAKELDPEYTMAYVGLGLTLGHQGDVQGGLHYMAQAEQLAVNAEEHAAVADGYDQLRKIAQ